MRFSNRAVVLAASSLLTISLLTIPTVVHAQTESGGSGAADRQDAKDPSEIQGQEILVTARLTTERAIDVPGTVTGVSIEDLAERNVLKFEDLNSIVPGLNLVDGPIATDAGVAFRGVQFDAGAQTGNTVTGVRFGLIPISVLGLSTEYRTIIRVPKANLAAEKSSCVRRSRIGLCEAVFLPRLLTNSSRKETQ